MDFDQSKIGLANYAASKIGARFFNFMDGSDSDRVITPIYDQCRKYVLEQLPWSFAIRTSALAKLSATLPNFGDNANIAYSLPPEFLKIYQVNFPSALLRFENLQDIGYCLLSDTSGLIIKYVFDNDDPTTYSSQFYEALACKIAKESCFKLVEAAQFVSQMKGDYEHAFLSAAAADGQMSSPDQINQSEWEYARLSGSQGFLSYPNTQIGFFPGSP